MNQGAPLASLTPAHADDLSLIRLELTLQSQSLRLERFSGNLWRSALGARLKQSFPVVFDALYGNEKQPGRLYALAPPSQPVQPGECFQFAITLFGPACQFAVACLQTLAGLGESGIGEQQQRFQLLSAHTPLSPAPLWQAGIGLTGWPLPQRLSDTPPLCTPEASQLRVDFLTPLSIEHENAEYFGEIPYAMLLARCYGRLAQIAKETGSRHPISPADYQQMLAASASVTHRAQAPLTAHETRRKSARSGQRMAFPGIVGSMHYQGPVGPGLRLIQLAQIVQLGRKTTFGFGCIGLELNPQDP